MRPPIDRQRGELRPSGYVGRVQELGYGLTGPLYDLMVAWTMLPLGGERTVRTRVASWLAPANGHDVLSLCCGTGPMERTILDVAPLAHVTGIDLGEGQLVRARRKDPKGRIVYRRANAMRTGFTDASFDRVLIVGALHEMPRTARDAVLREARRLCRRDGRFLAVEPCRTARRWSAVLRALLFFLWIPGNPEAATTADLIAHGLDTEMRAAGFEILERHVTSPDWFEGLLARPA